MLKYLTILLFYINKVHGECGYASCPVPLADHINVHLVPHTHDDVGWLKTIDQYYYGSRNNIQRAGVQYIIDSVIQELLKDPARRFIYVESAFMWRWWGEQDITMKETVRELVNEGRLEFISGGWSMNDEAAAHYSAIIDNMAVGIKFLKEEFGECGRPRIGWQIDPFGHSREYANILAKFGFDGLFLGRIDYADKDKRIAEKNMEEVWTAGEGGEEGELFTGINFHNYSPPPGFCFDTLCTDVIMDDKRLEDYNLDEKLASFISYTHEQANSYKTNNIMMTMGEDFNYQDANMWYKNLDKLIKYLNQTKADHNINLMYSTPSCYLKSVHDSEVSLSTKTDDFFPYASDPHAYWTGYFTSRPALKGMIRNANNLLQACKQVESSKPSEEEDPRLIVAKRSLAVNQHHDAVTGTAKQHVTDDYYLSLHRGMEACHQVISEGIRSQTGSECFINEWCPFLNVSQCAFTESREAFSMNVYNPMPRTETFHVRVPVVFGDEYKVTDPDQNEVEYQLIPIPDSVQVVPGRVSEAKFELIVKVTIPGLSSVAFNVVKQLKGYEGIKHLDLNSGKWGGISLQNENLKLELSRNGGIKKIKSGEIDINMNMKFEWYEPAVGNNEGFENRASGAYIFRPNGTSPNSLGDPVFAEMFKGPLVQEIHQVYSEWLSQVIRVYQDSQIVEYEWLVGPIPIEDGGKEIIAKYSSDLDTEDIFFTDSNGRGLIERQRNHRETWDLDLTEPVSANYYPVNSRIGVRSGSTEEEMWLLTDRSQGASSLAPGEIELMVHRRLLHDDAFGVGEALDEMAFGEGLVARGKHYMLLCTDGCADSSAQAADKAFAQPIVHFGELCADLRWNTRQSKELELPAYIKILTLEKWETSKVLVRIENTLSFGSDAHTVNLQDLFPAQTISAAVEMTLDGNIPKSEVSRFQWIKESNNIPPVHAHTNRMSVDGAEENLVVEAGFIKTVLVTLQ